MKKSGLSRSRSKIRRNTEGSADQLPRLMPYAPLPDEMKDNALRYLRQHRNNEHRGQRVDISLSALMEINTEQLHKSSRVQHRKSLAVAYASYICAAKMKEFEFFVIELAKKYRTKRDKRTDPLMLLIEHYVTYGDRRSRNDARKLYSRDTQAIRWLIDQGIPPAELELKAKEKGQSLRAWASNWSKKCKALKAPKSNIEPGHQSSSLYKITLTIAGPSGVTTEWLEMQNPPDEDRATDFLVRCGELIGEAADVVAKGVSKS